MYSECMRFVQATAPAEVVNSLVKDCTYSKFEQVVRQNIGHRVDWGALAQMFRLSQVAVQRVGVNSTAANDIQKFTMRYFQDQFAPWIVEQGGWVRYQCTITWHIQI